MNVLTASFTIAEYCQQMERHEIVTNDDYQRSDKVWPSSAQSYLIDSVLTGYPIPKISLYQSIDLLTRSTVKEIVDGQQRSKAIRRFFDNELVISTPDSDFHGATFESLTPEQRMAFLEYSLSIDLITDAEPGEIREIFTRYNSYTAPLNYEEKRHATYQGALKWEIVALMKRHSETFRQLGVFTKKTLTRMQDARFFTEVFRTLEEGLHTYNHRNLDQFYKLYDDEFPDAMEYQGKIVDVLDLALVWAELCASPLSKPSTFFTLFLAIWHRKWPVEALQEAFEVETVGIPDLRQAVQNLEFVRTLLDMDDEDLAEEYANLAEETLQEILGFVAASKAGTNTKNNRTTRFQYFCKALGNEPLP